MSDENNPTHEPTEAELGVKIEFDQEIVDIPPPRNAAVPFYPLDDLTEPGKPGSSMVIEGRKASQIAPSIARAKKRLPGRDFVARNLVPTEADPREGCRVWRTK